MPEVLPGEILGNQICKNVIFHVKKVFFFSLCMDFRPKNSRKSPKIAQKEGRNSIFLENSLSEIGVSLKSRFYRVKIVH